MLFDEYLNKPENWAIKYIDENMDMVRITRQLLNGLTTVRTINVSPQMIPAITSPIMPRFIWAVVPKKRNFWDFLHVV